MSRGCVRGWVVVGGGQNREEKYHHKPGFQLNIVNRPFLGSFIGEKALGHIGKTALKNCYTKGKVVQNG